MSGLGKLGKLGKLASARKSYNIMLTTSGKTEVEFWNQTMLEGEATASRASPPHSGLT